MNRQDREPTWVFTIVGIAITGVAAILANFGQTQAWAQLVSDISLNVGITIIAVSLIDWIWRRVGGDPLMNAINELRSATTLLGDLRNTGLKRVFLTRAQAGEQRNEVQDKMVQAREVDMMGIALRSGWSSNPRFQEIVRSRARAGKTKFRVMVLDPEAQVTQQRTFEEDGQPSNRISEAASSTLRTMLQIKQSLPEDNQDFLKIKVIQETNIYCSIVRADDMMVVTKYVLHLSGGNSEMLEIEGSEGTLFKLYQNEFNATWNRALDWPR